MAEEDYMLQFLKKLKLYTKLIPETVHEVFLSKFFVAICISTFRSSRPEVFLRKGILNICSKSTGEHPCRSVISIKLQSIFIENTLRHGCSHVDLLHIFRTPFPKNSSGWLLLNIITKIFFTTRTSHWITASSVKLRTLPENAPGICLTYCFSFY